MLTWWLLLALMLSLSHLLTRRQSSMRDSKGWKDAACVLNNNLHMMHAGEGCTCGGHRWAQQPAVPQGLSASVYSHAALLHMCQVLALLMHCDFPCDRELSETQSALGLSLL